MRAHQDVTTERSAVHHPDVEGRVEELVFRQVLGERTWIQHGRGSSNVATVGVCRHWTITTSNHLTSVLKLGFFL